MASKLQLFLDDTRNPRDPRAWRIARNYKEFCDIVTEVGYANLSWVTLDHDLGESGPDEKTGLDCAKFLVEQYLDTPGNPFPLVTVHSANPVGSDNIIGYMNSFFRSAGLSFSAPRIDPLQYGFTA